MYPCVAEIHLDSLCWQQHVLVVLMHVPSGNSLPFCVPRVAVEVVTTMTSADVMWQDGTVETNIRSNELIPVHHLDNNEFCPGDFVVDKRGIGCQNSALLREQTCS